MTISASDLVFRKSEIINDISTNGGRKGYDEVVGSVKYNIFPRVPISEQVTGKTRVRKIFLANENDDDEEAANALAFIECPSNGADYIVMALGSQSNTYADVVAAATAPTFIGCGSLNAALETDDTEAVILMEDDEIEFPNGGVLHVSDKFMVSQTIAAGVKIGDSVEYVTDTWQKITFTDDIAYPNGRYIGSNKVMTVGDDTNEEWIDLKDNLYTAEVLGTGDGTTSPTLATLTHVTNGICKQLGKRPVLNATHGATTYVVNVAANGDCSGDCSAGKLNMTTGAWTTPIVWAGTVDNATNVTITYRENCFSYSGNVCTVQLDAFPANAYAASNTYASGCLEQASILATADDWDDSDTTSGTYDQATYPVVIDNIGTVEDTFTIEFTSATAFTCSGTNEGSLGTGAVGTDFVPVNAETGKPYFTIDKDGWGGTWAIGDTVTFPTHASAMPIWLKEVVPAEAATVQQNLFVLGFYCE
jgi:hypothetical protein